MVISNNILYLKSNSRKKEQVALATLSFYYYLKIFGNTGVGAGYVAVFAAEVLAGSNGTGLSYSACVSDAP